MLPRSRRFTRDFKIKVLREIEGGQRPFEVARKYEIHQRLISKWRKKFFEEGERAFAKGPTASSESGTVAELERSSLTKTGEPSRARTCDPLVRSLNSPICLSIPQYSPVLFS